MPSFRTGTVTSIVSERPGLQRVEVDGEPAYVLTRLIGPVQPGDKVVVNTTAVDLGLGSGGAHVVHWNLSRDEWSEPGPGHIIKLRYTSLQADTGAAEEHPDYTPPETLDGMPVVACALHSQLPCVAVTFKHHAPDKRLVFVMTDGGALPLALSDLVSQLTGRGLVDATVTAGHAFGGDHEAVNLASALEVAKAAAEADAVVVATGPGVVGTGTRLGFSGLEVAAVIDAAGVAKARPIVALRYSDADPRERHRGVSHHSTTALAHAHERAVVPIPAREPTLRVDGPHKLEHVLVPDVPALLRAAGLSVTTMGRGPDDDPKFYEYAGAAGVVAARLVP